MVPTPPSLALEVNCPMHVTSGLVRDWILIVPEPSRLPSASPTNNSPAIVAMTGPVEEKSPAPAGLAGWASPAGAGLFSSTGPVIAIIAGELFLGEAEGNLDGSGTIKIQSRTKPDVTCIGQFTSSAKLGGVGTMRCSDGATATIQFQS